MAVIAMNKDYPNYDPKIRDQFIHSFQDRGMMKWGGFYLSDHTRVIEKSSKQRAEKERRFLRERMDFKTISQRLFDAFSNHKEVQIQLAEESEEHGIYATILGFVEGYDETGILVADKVVAVNDIWNCQLIEN